jgi:Fe-S cluster assembly iron-binding protein IscA
VTAQTRLPMLDFLPGYPNRLSFREARNAWWSETKWFLRHTLTPTKTQLPDPERSITLDSNVEQPPDLKERLSAAKSLVDSAEARLNTVRAKATSLLGFVAIVTPIVSWWLLSGRARLASAPIALEITGYFLELISALCLSLSLLALLRCQGVVSYTCLTPDLVVDFESGSLKPHDWRAELRGQVLTWGSVQRWSDVITDFFRAGQRFLVLSLLAGVLAGFISYICPQPTTPVTLVQRTTGELALVGLSTPTIPNSIPRLEEFLWNLVSFAVGLGIMFIISRSYYRKRNQGAGHQLERRDFIKLTPLAAAKIRECQAKSGGQFLRVGAKQNSSGLIDRTLGLELDADPANDFLGDSQGIQILVARSSAPLLNGCLLDWIIGPDGKEGFCINVPSVN